MQKHGHGVILRRDEKQDAPNKDFGQAVVQVRVPGLFHKLVCNDDALVTFCQGPLPTKAGQKYARDGQCSRHGRAHFIRAQFKFPVEFLLFQGSGRFVGIHEVVLSRENARL